MILNVGPGRFGDIGIRLLILVLASVVLMALQVTGRLEPVQSVITQLTSPAQVGATGATESIAGAFDFLFELRNLRQRNAELEQVNSNFLVENFELREVQRENEVMRQLLRFAQTRPGVGLARRADCGARHRPGEQQLPGVYHARPGRQPRRLRWAMPVVTDQGLVGRISDVTDTTSKVLLITDANSAVNAILQSSRLNGVVRGTPGGDVDHGLHPAGRDL